MIAKLLSKLLSFDLILNILNWKLHKIHNVRESWANGKCDLCTAFFKLKEEIKELSKFSDDKAR
ncbi:MAG: hypothetical protein PHX80_05575 [Candidatus Nanoarchaeia archaeon]|nr:hypothetical protein [Candidatus Nanoarchaeia archaeon]